MKIRGVEVYLAQMGVQNRPHVRILTDEGLHRIGEAYPCGPDQATVKTIEYLAEEGVDACWVGPGDLAASMGVDLSTPQGAAAHTQAILVVREDCRQTGKIPSICALGDAQRWLEQGFLFVTAASDYGYLLADAPATLRALGRPV